MTRLSLAAAAFCAVVMAVAPSAVDARAVSRASSSISLPFVRRMNTTGIRNLLQVDQARARALKARAKSNPGGVRFPMAPTDDVPATNQVVDYVATVAVGDPPTECKSFDVRLVYRM